MGWFQDYASFVSKLPLGNIGSSSMLNSVANNDMDAARVQSFISGIPYIGGVVRGIDQTRFAEDYYRNTGIAPKYPSLTYGSSGLSSGIGNGLLGAASVFGGSGGYNVKEGTHDLLSFYNYAYA